MLEMNLTQDIQTQDRVIKARKKQAQARYEPTLQEVWYTGYEKKKGIYQTKISAPDRKRLESVQQAIDSGELGLGVDTLRKFTKAHALRLYKVLAESRRDATIADMVENMPSNYYCVRDELSFGMMISHIKTLSPTQVIGLDTETTGLNVWQEDECVGISISIPETISYKERHVYIPIRHVERYDTGFATVGEDGDLDHETRFRLIDGQLPADYVFRGLKEYLESPKLKKVLHNATFDAHVFKREGIDLKGIYMDTMIAMHVLNENEPTYALKNLATKYGERFGFEDKSATYEELFGKGGFQETPLDIGTVYACKDTHLTLRFSEWIEEHLHKAGLWEVYFETENPVLEVSIAMEQLGFVIDTEWADEYVKNGYKKLRELERELCKHFGDININSNQQLARVLFDELKLKDHSKKRSVDKKALKKLSKQCEGVQVLLDYRKVHKVVTTYIEPIPSKVGYDGRLHGQFKQAGTVTGRFSSSNPNLQNLDKNARQMFIAPKGKVIVGIDFSQQEPRLLAHMSNDETLINTYKEGRDLYSEMASKTFKKPIEECGDGSTYRKQTKILVLAILYGMADFTVSEILGIEYDEASKLRNDFLDTFPKVKAYIQGVKDIVDKQGYVREIGGRKRRFKGHTENVKQFKAVERDVRRRIGDKQFNSIWEFKNLPYKLKRRYSDLSRKVEGVHRQAVNFTIQGSASTWTKRSLIEAHRWCKEQGDDYHLICTVHDENLFELPETVTREQIEEVERRMNTAITINVPSKTDVAIMRRWAENEQTKEEWFNVS